MSRTKEKIFEKGFTLVEALVAVAVFAVAMSAIVGSFLAVLRIDEKSRAIRVVEQNARFLSEFITREIRNGSLNYLAYGASVPQPKTTALHLTNNSGQQERIFLNGTAAALEKIGIGTSDLTSSNVQISNLYFYIAPPTDPFCADPCPNQQPRVTFTLTISSNITGRLTDQASIRIQSTVSSRQYPSL